MTTTECVQDPAALLRRKWRGIEELQLLMQGIADLISDERNEFESRLAQAIGHPGPIMIGTRKCEKSPSRTCVYEFTLGGSDECLICDNPNERK